MFFGNPQKGTITNDETEGDKLGLGLYRFLVGEFRICVVSFQAQMGMNKAHFDTFKVFKVTLTIY